MTTASIPELRKAHTRTRAQLARATVRYGKRALAGRGSGEDGPPSDQEVALVRELLAAAEAMTAAAREHRAAANWQPQQQPWAGVAGANPDAQQPWAGVAGANPDPLSGLWWAAFRLDTAKAAGDQAATIEAGKALQHHIRRWRSLSAILNRKNGSFLTRRQPEGLVRISSDLGRNREHGVSQ